MIAQDGINTRYTPFQKRIDYNALRLCLKKLRKHIGERDISIHMPKIGTGLGGGNWDIIKKIISDELYDLQIYVYTI